MKIRSQKFFFIKVLIKNTLLVRGVDFRWSVFQILCFNSISRWTWLRIRCRFVNRTLQFCILFCLASTTVSRADHRQFHGICLFSSWKLDNRYGTTIDLQCTLQLRPSEGGYLFSGCTSCVAYRLQHVEAH
uniref:Uncharacterized protein n=1 Tax=Physcomitrium patens TaxID=3218 RepID=A0A2K1K5X4_PHYPA|nr:hypothetical protein PHYPA_011077 [Physcomitrium patens]